MSRHRFVAQPDELTHRLGRLFRFEIGVEVGQGIEL